MNPAPDNEKRPQALEAKAYLDDYIIGLPSAGINPAADDKKRPQALGIQLGHLLSPCDHATTRLRDYATTRLDIP